MVQNFQSGFGIVAEVGKLSPNKAQDCDLQEKNTACLAAENETQKTCKPGLRSTQFSEPRLQIPEKPFYP